MKKILSLLFLTAMLTVVLSSYASAASFTGAADNLLTMGLFLGTDKGYELDREPTRAEAAVMLTRLLGKEEYAKTLEYSAPFDDVPIWAEPYVQYLYSADLTKGTSQTTYSPNQPCTLQMYATFLLRSLGYSDTNSDFSYAEAVNFARSKSIINDYNYSDDSFLRDNVVAMSYTTLFCPTASGDHPSLLDKLIADGAIDVDAAAETKELFDFVRVYDDAVNAVFASGTYNVSNTYTAKIELGGEPYIQNTLLQNIYISLGKNSVDSSAASVYTESNTEYSKYGVTRENSYSVYYKDGTVYIVNSDGSVNSTENDFPGFISNYNSVDTVSEKLALILSSERIGNEYNFTLTQLQTEKILNRIIENVQMDANSSKIDLEVFDYGISVDPDPVAKIHTVFTAEINSSVFRFDISVRSVLKVSDAAVVIPEF